MGQCSARKQIVQKVGKFQIMMQYAAHKFEAALGAYSKGNYESAVRYWDQWWAFYAGSQVTNLMMVQLTRMHGSSHEADLHGGMCRVEWTMHPTCWPRCGLNNLAQTAS